MAVNGSSYVLVCGGVNGHVDIRSLWNLCLLMTNDLSHRGSVSYLGFSVGMYITFHLLLLILLLFGI